MAVFVVVVVVEVEVEVVLLNPKSRLHRYYLHWRRALGAEGKEEAFDLDLDFDSGKSLWKKEEDKSVVPLDQSCLSCMALDHDVDIHHHLLHHHLLLPRCHELRRFLSFLRRQQGRRLGWKE